jgi:ADP-heptose:LPS heptosyltransferase
MNDSSSKPQKSLWERNGMDPSLPLGNKIDRWIKLRLINLAEKAFARKIHSPDVLDRLHPKRVLIVRPHDQLGDFLLSTPAIDALRNRFPDARLGILVKDYFADAVANHPALDSVLVFYPKISGWTRERLCRFGRALFHRWDFAVILSSESHSLTSDVLAVLSGAKIILGSERFVFPGCMRNFLYNLSAPDSGRQRHQTERNLDIIAFINGKTPDLREKVYVSQSEKLRLAAELKKRLPKQGQSIVGLHIGANKAPNRWPAEHFAELANRIHSTLNANVLLFWGPREADLAEQFMQRVSFEPVRMPPSTLRNLSVHFSLCDAAVCNDTGIMHLCAAVGTPLVALFGPIDPTFWKPIGKQIVAVRGPENKTENIRVEDVFQKLNLLLRQKR